MNALRLLAVEDRPTLLYGGQERSLFELLPALKNRAFDITLAYREPGELLERYESAGIRTIRQVHRQLDRARPWLIPSQILEARRVLQAVRPQVVYVNQYFDLPVIALAASMARIPVVCHLRLAAPSYLSHQYRFALNRCTALIANSGFTLKSWVAAGIPESRIHLVPNGLDFESYTFREPEPGSVNQPVNLLYAGRLAREKGVAFLLEVFSALVLADRSQDIRLVIAGEERGADAPPGWFGEALSKLPEAVRLRIHPMPAISDIKPLLHKADLVLFPTLVPESFGRIAVEAMACGTPVLASRIGAVPEVLGPYSSWLAEPGSVSGWLSGIRNLMHMKRTGGSGLKQARNYAADRFGFVPYVDRMAAVLSSAARF